MSTPMSDDPVLRRFREQISDTDRAILNAVNRRLALVAQVKSYKESCGLDFLDPEREEWLLRELTRLNGGPLSAGGLRELLTAILDLTKREVSQPPGE